MFEQANRGTECRRKAEYLPRGKPEETNGPADRAEEPGKETEAKKEAEEVITVGNIRLACGSAVSSYRMRPAG